MSTFIKSLNETTNMQWDHDDAPLDHGNKHGDVLARFNATHGGLRFVAERVLFVEGFSHRHSHDHRWRVYDDVTGEQLADDGYTDYPSFADVGTAIEIWRKERRNKTGGTFVTITVDTDYDSEANYSTYGCEVMTDESELLKTTVGYDSVAEALADICHDAEDNDWIITDVTLT